MLEKQYQCWLHAPASHDLGKLDHKIPGQARTLGIVPRVSKANNTTWNTIYKQNITFFYLFASASVAGGGVGLRTISTLSCTPCKSNSPSYATTLRFFAALSVPTSASNMFAHLSSWNSTPNVTFNTHTQKTIKI